MLSAHFVSYMGWGSPAGTGAGQLAGKRTSLPCRTCGMNWEYFFLILWLALHSGAIVSKCNLLYNNYLTRFHGWHSTCEIDSGLTGARVFS